MSSLRWKLVLTAFVCLAAPLYFLNRYTISSFDRFTRTALENEMVGHASMAAELYTTLLPATPDATTTFASLLHTYSTNTESRLQFVDTNGTVRVDGLGDSVGESLIERPEIAQALHGSYGARWDLTPDRRFVYYYCAMPIRTADGTIAGAIRVTRHTGPITKAIHHLARDQHWAFALSLLFAAAVSVVIGHTMTRRLHLLTAATRAHALGQPPPPRPAGGHDEIAELGHAIDRMAHDLEARHRYNRDFVATTLHELKTPVTAIRGAVEVLESGAINKPAAREKFLANLRFEAERLTRLVGELGELTRVDTEDLRERRTTCDYVACVRDILDRLRPTFTEPHATLDVALPDEPLTAAIVPERIEQVLANLLENALRYTPADGRVTVRVTRPTPAAILTTVEDTGPGIPPAQLERIFDRFYTTEPKGIPRDYGTGLGLAIARSIIEHHQGRIWAENAPPHGALLSFTLPSSSYS